MRLRRPRWLRLPQIGWATEERPSARRASDQYHLYSSDHLMGHDLPDEDDIAAQTITTRRGLGRR